MAHAREAQKVIALELGHDGHDHVPTERGLVHVFDVLGVQQASAEVLVLGEFEGRAPAAAVVVFEPGGLGAVLSIKLPDRARDIAGVAARKARMR